MRHGWWQGAGHRGLGKPPVIGFHFTPYDVNHILSTGQSLSVGADGDPALSTTQPFANLMFTNGVYPFVNLGAPLIPLVEGPGVETMSSGLANLITQMSVEDSLDPIVSIVSCHGAGGTEYAGIKKGTSFYQLGMDQMAAAKDHADNGGLSYCVRAVTVVHGESDYYANNHNYDADMIEFQSDYETDVQLVTGQTLSVPLFHSQTSSMAQSWIPLLQLKSHIDAPGKVILVGPKYQYPQAGGAGLHLTNHGYRRMGEDYAKAYRKVVLEGGTWEPFRPKTITRDGAIITIVFYVPTPPIVLDTTLVAMSNPHYGFDYVDATTDPWMPAVGQSPTVSSVSITAEDTVEITLSGTPTVPGYIRYGIHWYEITGPRGNLRDSDTTASRHGYDLSNWCVQFAELITP